MINNHGPYSSEIREKKNILDRVPNQKDILLDEGINVFVFMYIQKYV